MSCEYNAIETASTDLRGFSLVARADGSPITSGTVNWYLKALTGANAGKWWRTSDGTWQVAETANAMTHQADGHWTVNPVGNSLSPFDDAVLFVEYAKESANLHIPIARMLKTSHTPSADASKRVSLTTLDSAVLHSGTAQAGASGSITLAAGASATNDLYIGELVKVYGGAGAGQTRTITAYNGSTKVATVDRNWVTNPDNTSTYAVIAADNPDLDAALQIARVSSVDNLTGGQITVSNPVASNGDTTIIRGDDYNTADGRALTYTDTDNSWPDNPTAVKWRVFKKSAATQVLEKDMVVTPASGPGKVGKVDLTAAETAALKDREYHLAATWTKSARDSTRIQGTLTVNRR